MVSIATGGEEEQPKAKPAEDRKVVHENFVTRKGKSRPFLFTTNLSLILGTMLGFIKKYKREFLSLEFEGEHLRSFKDESKRKIQLNFPMTVSYYYLLL